MIFCGSVVAGVILACGGDDKPSAQGAASPSATATPTTAAASTAAASGSPASTTLTGKYFEPQITVTVPSSDWKTTLDTKNEFVLEQGRGASGPEGGIAMFFPQTVYDALDGITKEAPPADLVAWVKTNHALNVVAEEAATIGGYPATRMEIRGDSGDDIHLVQASDGTFNLSYNEHSDIYVLDAGGRQLLIISGPRLPTEYEKYVSAARPILASIRFASP